MAQRDLAGEAHEQAEPDHDQRIVGGHGELRQIKGLARGERQELDERHDGEQGKGRCIAIRFHRQ